MHEQLAAQERALVAECSAGAAIGWHRDRPVGEPLSAG